MVIAFTKMQGLGNDFVVIDAISQTVSLTAQQIRRLADRHFGIGCDQVLLVERPQGAAAPARPRKTCAQIRKGQEGRRQAAAAQASRGQIVGHQAVRDQSVRREAFREQNPGVRTQAGGGQGLKPEG